LIAAAVNGENINLARRNLRKAEIAERIRNRRPAHARLVGHHDADVGDAAAAAGRYPAADGNRSGGRRKKRLPETALDGKLPAARIIARVRLGVRSRNGKLSA